MRGFDGWDKDDALTPLDCDNIEDEVVQLYEDMLNWECGHILFFDVDEGG
jgi:hypothetical protein